jgi:hypothetical protein
VRGENMHSWGKSITSKLLGDILYAIPKAKPAPKEYVVHGNFISGNEYVIVGEDFKPGDRVTVQRVSEQGEPR